MTKRSRKLQRTGKYRPSRGGDAWMVVVEGKTELAYIQALKSLYRLHGPRIVVKVAGESSAEKIVEEARFLKEKNEAESREGEAIFDAVWVVFDAEFDKGCQAQAHKALQKSKEYGIRAAISVPLFEYWLLLHFECHAGPYSNKNDVTSRLRKACYENSKLKKSCLNRKTKSNTCKGYEKTSCAEVIGSNRANVDIALKNAESRRSRFYANGLIGSDNQFISPGADVDILVRELSQLRG